MKWPKVMRSFEYCPSNIEFPCERPRPENKPTPKVKDRYYTQSRSLHVKHLVRQVMRGMK